MSLHQLTSVTIGVPDVAPVAAYYAEFGLSDLGDGSFATIDGGRQLRITRAPTRRLIDLTVGADDPDDLDRIAANLAGLGSLPGLGADDRNQLDLPVGVPAGGQNHLAAGAGDAAGELGEHARVVGHVEA